MSTSEVTATATVREQAPRDPRRAEPGRRPPLGRILVYVALTVGAIVVLAPIVWVVLSSFKTQEELFQRPPTILPQAWRIQNYTEALNQFRFPLYLRNTVIVTVAATALTVTINSMAAFAFAKYRFRGRSGLFLLCLGSIMIPLEVILIPVFLVAAQLGLVDTFWGLIIPPAATPTGMFLLRQYMLTIPEELLESARLDGASEWQVFWKIVRPLSMPAIVVVTIFSVIWRWNDFLWPLIMVQRDEILTLQVALTRFQGQLVVSWNYVLAMTVVSILPVVLVFLFMQRHLVTGIASMGTKG